MDRRNFFKAAAGVGAGFWLPEPARVAYSFAGGWYGRNLIRIDGIWRPLIKVAVSGLGVEYMARRTDNGVADAVRISDLPFLGNAPWSLVEPIYMSRAHNSLLVRVD